MHAEVMLAALGLAFLPGVVLMHFATHWTYMARKVAHATLQVVGVALLGVGLLAVGIDGPGHTLPSPAREAHAAAGYALLFGGVPAVLLARLPSLRRHHNALGRALLVSLSATAVLGAWQAPRHLQVLALLLLAAHLAVALWTASHAYPTLASVVARDADAGVYHVREPYRSEPARLRELRVVGSGWTEWLQHQVGVDRPQVFARSLAGPVGEGGLRWGAGTTIRAVQAALAARGRTLPSHPSVVGATLGGWIATGSHGSAAGGPPPLGARTVLDARDGAVRTLGADAPHVVGRHIVLDVEVRPVANARVVRRAFEMRSEADAARFLAPDVRVRVLFVDAVQALCFVWLDDDGGGGRGRGGAPVPPWLATLLPACVARHLPRAWWDGTRTTLARAHQFSPDPPYYGGLASLAYTNFELFVVPARTLTPARLDALRVWLQRDVFGARVARGRCEVRYERGTLYLDFALLGGAPRAATLARWRAQLEEDVLGPLARVAQHAGKRQVPL